MELDKVAMGRRIGHIRHEMKMNKEQFSKLIGMTGQQLGTTEHGTTGLSIERLVKICEVAGVSSDYILFGKENDLLESEIKNNLLDYNEDNLNTALMIVKALIKHTKFKNNKTIS